VGHRISPESGDQGDDAPRRRFRCSRQRDGGRASTLLFKAYEQGRAKWQANTVDYVWFDEEPPEDVYFEGITRTNATRGAIAVTFTPLKGVIIGEGTLKVKNEKGLGVAADLFGLSEAS
jgi:phage terminase large subunit-like protein